MMELLSVNQAATILGIDDSRVRQLLRAGVLEGQQVGGRWLVDGHSARQRKERGSAGGRSLSVRNAWGLLAALSGQRTSGLSDAEWSRITRRLRNMTAHDALSAVRLGELVRARAVCRRYRVHSGLLPTLLADPDVVRGGTSAATHVGADYVAPGRAEIYVHPDRVGKLEAGFGLVRDSTRGNLLVRIPPSEVWPFLRSGPDTSAEGRDAPVSVVAADLLDIQEDRADTAAADLLRHLGAALPYKRREAE
ncbi:helix-turn-helix domain-containing protein [Streptomyces europaeiscabiei]|uniref:helix-turn-helix domain-containing protein n=1 Tax=Streptomyces europaeiscabiei TaxID=146819 RepID=UPI002E124BA5|nr:type IV toxin-antitoxin system AbiEi family antitoxin [Streptomyces europaeiscabiei]